MRGYQPSPKFVIRFINQWPDADIVFNLVCIDVAFEGWHPRLYLGFMGFLLEIGWQGYV